MEAKILKEVGMCKFTAMENSYCTHLKDKRSSILLLLIDINYFSIPFTNYVQSSSK